MNGLNMSEASGPAIKKSKVSLITLCSSLILKEGTKTKPLVNNRLYQHRSYDSWEEVLKEIDENDDVRKSDVGVAP